MIQSPHLVRHCAWAIRHETLIKFIIIIIIIIIIITLISNYIIRPLPLKTLAINLIFYILLDSSTNNIAFLWSFLGFKELCHATCCLLKKLKHFFNWIPKIMVQFCHLRLYLGTETISCRLCQRIERMDMDWNLNKLGQLFQVLMLYLQNHQKISWLVLLNDICLKSST